MQIRLKGTNSSNKHWQAVFIYAGNNSFWALMNDFSLSFGCKSDLLASALTNISTEARPRSEILTNQIGSEIREFGEKVHIKYLSLV